ncbi:diguanylate cyclase [Luteimonas sp. SJ-92]|uniref:diguanylate cyclase n=1 Tax=Luteimonas salinisoli TaxID=2752307 RepID=A0A853JFX7_9GAMM|nr:ligand-binding sensor domain-containing diguanylate cyclase [Luteimonas salinisoli]NZA28246.1 diguanylate cyclase [Luteimonas salinisoli]
MFGSRRAPTRLATCALLLGAATAACAEPQQFRHYSAVDGLPQAQVTALHQDRHGFLWAGTFGGLGRFDGRAFAQFTTADGLSSNTVQAIASEADGTVWAGQSRGLCLLRAPRARFECPDLAGIAQANVQALLVVGDALWVGAREGLYLLRRDAEGNADAETVVDDDVAALAPDGEGGVWVGGRQGLRRIGPAGPGPMLALRDGAGVRALLRDGERLWIGTDSGLLLYRHGQVTDAPGLDPALPALEVRGLALGPDGRLRAATRLGLLHAQEEGFVLLGQESGLANDNLYAVLRDREDILWIASDAGLSSLVDGAFVGYGERDGLWQGFVRALAEDERGRLWLGTRRGVQVVAVDAAGRLHEQFRITHEDGLVDDRIYDIEFPAPGEALLATGNGLAHWREGEGLLRLYTEDDGLPGNGVRALQPLPGGDVFVATRGGMATLRDGAVVPIGWPALAQAQVISINRGDDGRVWFGALQGGLLRLDRDGVVRRFDAAAGLSDETIWDVAPDRHGGAWAGSNGDGLFHVAADGAISRHTRRDGLVDDFVWQVLVDRGGSVWAYTNRGLSRFDGGDFSNYGLDDGLLDQEGAATAALETAAGDRWFASNDGLMRYVDSERDTAGPAPVAVIHQALAAGEPIVQDGALQAGSRSLEFHFSAPLFRRNPDLLYRYRLRGADEAWVEMRANRPIAYANLGPGRYVFEAQARKAGQPWPQSTAAFGFEVRPPPWQTPLARGMLALFAVLTVWGLVRLRIRHVEARRRALQQLVSERTRALEQANDRLEHASFTDPLTDLRNRRFLAHQVVADVAEVRRRHAGGAAHPNRDMIFAMVDVDHFKRINDTFGHAAGDRVLRTYAEVIRAVIRESDYAVRWGGEEFLLVARHTEAAQCGALATRLVERVRATRFVVDDAGTAIDSTCSVGLARFPFAGSDVAGLGWEQVVDVCDAAVYLAKAGGRDGWVAIQGAPGVDLGEPARFMRRLKRDPLALAAEGSIVLSGTRCPADPDRPAPGRAPGAVGAT